MEDLLSEMQDGKSTHTQNFHCIKSCVWAPILTPDRLLCLVVFLFGWFVFRSQALSVAHGVASLEWMEQRDKVWL